MPPRLLRLCLVLLALFPLPGRAEKTTVQLAPGITYTQEIVTGSAPQIINCVRVDLKAPGVSVRYGQANDSISLKGATKGRETLPSLAARQRALVAINGDFFPYTGDPLGIAIRDGEYLSEPMEYRAGLGIGPSGIQMGVFSSVATWNASQSGHFPLDCINRAPRDDETILLTPAYTATPALSVPFTAVLLRDVNLPVQISKELSGLVANVVQGGARDPLPACPSNGVVLVAVGKAQETLSTHSVPESRLSFRFDLAATTAPPTRGRYPSRSAALRGTAFPRVWTDVQQAIGGGPWLVRDGQIAIDGEAQDFDGASFINKRHPRAAAGVDTNGRLLLVTVDGRQPGSQGASLTEMARILLELGAVNAINLDGGGSTTMVVQNSVVNAPSDGRARPVANGLLVYGAPPEPVEAVYRLRPAQESVTVRAGEPLALAVLSTDDKPVHASGSGGRRLPPLWGTEDGFGFVSQSGVFTGYKLGTGRVVCTVGGQRLSLSVQVVSGPPALVRASLEVPPEFPVGYALLKVTVLDRHGNPVPHQAVTVKVTGGELAAPLMTDANGKASSEIAWNSKATEGLITLSVPGAPTVTLKRAR